MFIECFFCNKRLAKNETKNCGGCKAVIYCSRECQKDSWRREHKEICPRISNPQNDNDELRLWSTLWSTTFRHATVWALDIRNNPGYNMTHALMIFVAKTRRTDHPAQRYRIVGECIVPITLPLLKWHDIKSGTPGRFYFSVQDPEADDGFRCEWNTPLCSLLPSLLSKPDSASLGKLAGPILRHLTSTFSHVDAAMMWDPDLWLRQSHPLVKPENITVMPEVVPEMFAHLFK